MGTVLITGASYGLGAEFARILAANLELGKEPAIKNSIKTMQALMQNLPKELSSNSAKIEGKKRLKEMKDFLNTLSAYTISGQAI